MNEREIRQMVGEILIVGFDGLDVPGDVEKMIQQQWVGNVILFQRNVGSAKQLGELTQTLQRTAMKAGHVAPLIICTDQENGTVGRLGAFVPGLPGSMALGATDSVKLAYRIGQETGHLLKSFGVNTNLAPVMDINNNPDNPVIGVRSFGDQPQTVALLSTAMFQGLQDAEVIACGKHFPGHGDTTVDSHRGLPVISHARQRLEALEWIPFVHAIAAGIDTLMTAHVVFPGIESDSNRPATLSSRVLTDLLRNELGFSGVIMTDCLEMDAIAQTVGVGRGAVEAVMAGADMVLVSHRWNRQMEAIEALVRAVLDQELSLDRLRTAYHRVIKLKKRRLTWESIPSRYPELISSSKILETKRLQEDVSVQAVTVLRMASDFPKGFGQIRRVAVLHEATGTQWIASGPQDRRRLLADAVSLRLPLAEVDDLSYPGPWYQEDREQLFSRLSQYDLIVSGIDGIRNQPYVELVHDLFSLAVPHAVILLRLPYDAAAFKEAPTLLAVYENTPWMVDAALRVLLGEAVGLGKLPVWISEQWPRGFSAIPQSSHDKNPNNLEVQ